MVNVNEASVGHEEMPVRTNLTSEEKRRGEERYVQLSVEIEKARDVLREAKKIFKDAVRPQLEESGVLLKLISRGYREETKTCYLIPDYEKGEMQYTLESGEIVFTRRIRPGERQMNIFPMNGTENQ